LRVNGRCKIIRKKFSKPLEVPKNQMPIEAERRKRKGMGLFP
jgi:hypothetical protein